uniref:Uncharacterized protein n=1 Tax=Rhizophora mucronata TaxID=61149 RepID=A0A2P2Q292_RHIMU
MITLLQTLYLTRQHLTLKIRAARESLLPWLMFLFPYVRPMFFLYFSSL